VKITKENAEKKLKEPEQEKKQKSIYRYFTFERQKVFTHLLECNLADFCGSRLC